MKLLLVAPGPSFSVADVCRGWKRAFENLGVDVGDMKYDDRFFLFTSAHIRDDRTDEWVKAFDMDAAVKIASEQIIIPFAKFLPDVVFIVSGFFVEPSVLDLIRMRGAKVVLLCTESPYQDDTQVGMAEHADVTLLNDPTNIDLYPDNTFYVPHCYDPTVHTPGPVVEKYRSDFAFVGTAYPSRIDFLQQVDFGGIDVKFAGMWRGAADTPLEQHVIHPLDECFLNDDTVDVYRSCKMSANLYRHEAQQPELEYGWSVGPREVELAAVGCPFIREPRGEGDELFPMLPTFDSPEDFGEKLRWFLTHETEREDAATRARKAVVDRTFENNARRLLNCL